MGDQKNLAPQGHQTNTGLGAVQIGHAGRDVKIKQVMAPPPAEYELQARFHQATGIRCGRPARAQLEQLMEHHGFSSWQLSRAWNAGALVWDQRAGRLRVGSRRFDLVVGWTGVASFSLAWVIGMVMSIGLHGEPGHPFVSLLAAGGCLAWVGSLLLMMFMFIWPQHVARQAEQALGRGLS